MFRNIINDLAGWYEREEQKAALIKGGKAVGKTWAALDFATGFFDEYIVIDLAEYPDLLEYISKERKPDKVHAKLVTTVDKYDFEGKLLIFDNAQLNTLSIKNLAMYAGSRKDCRVLIIATAGGKLDIEDQCKDILDVFEMTPMTFEEFLKAGKGRKLCKYIENQMMDALSDEVRESVKTMLETFFLTGGMPEVVSAYYKNESFIDADAALVKLLDRINEYIVDTAPRRSLCKVVAVWKSIPKQLTKDNKKFMYGYVDPKARAREYEDSVEFLVKAGVVNRVYRIKEGVLPLENQVDEKSFELYHLDHGLLRIMSEIKCTDVDLNNVYDTMGGVIAEQYAYSELKANKKIGTLYFWISSATAKVDFVYEGEGEVIPVDVQTAPHSKAQSVKVFTGRYNNNTSVRISTDDMYVKKGLLNIPLYGIWNF